MLLPCKMCGAPAVEQVRGILQRGDKGWVGPLADRSEVEKLAPHIREDRGVIDVIFPPSETYSSNNPANALDTRVICSNPAFEMRDGMPVYACDAATGWNKQDFADYTRFLWNRDHAAQP